MTGALTIRLRPSGAEIAAGPAFPLEALMLGRAPEAVAELLPRVFNLCPVAQATAVRLALGLTPPDAAALETEIRRDHRLRLSVLWPRLLGLAGGSEADALPAPADIDAWLARHPLFARIASHFPAGCAVADLPAARSETVMRPLAQDNSPAARREDHPTLRAVAERWGKGPLWRAMARLADLAAPPPPRLLADGTAVVAAARGLYAVRARAEGGRVTAFARKTPTDHLAAPGGVMEKSFSTLPADRGGLAPLLLAILDPCVPASVAEAADA